MRVRIPLGRQRVPAVSRSGLTEWVPVRWVLITAHLDDVYGRGGGVAVILRWRL
jgi:hypothetical protein